MYDLQRLHLAILLFIIYLLTPGWGEAVSAHTDNLVTNGGFEKYSDSDSWPDGWEQTPQGGLMRSGDNTWLVLNGSQASTRQVVPLKREWWKLKLTMRMRVTNVVMGEEGWQDARLAMSFYDTQGQRVGPWPNVFHAEGSTDWIECERVYVIPPDADHLILNPANFGTGGKVEFDDIRIMVSQEHPSEKSSVGLPESARDVWNLETAWRRRSSTRETICLNDLWRLRPLMANEGETIPVEDDSWSWFKVPGIWPNTIAGGDPISQEILLDPWLEERMQGQSFDRAWVAREIAVPDDWQGRRILLDFTMVQTHARVFLDGEQRGEVWFPGGMLDITRWAKPGQKCMLQVLLTARPLERESTAFMAPDRVITRRASVKLKGLTGDVFLVSEPQEVAIADVHVICSTRQKTITFDVGLRHPSQRVQQANVRILTPDSQPVRELPIQSVERSDGRLHFTASWEDPRLWDTDTPENLYDAVVTLYDASGQVLDESLPVRFGFREFWIEGRDFYLNGRRIHPRALHTSNINSRADRASFDASRETFRRMREYGFNFFITANYDFTPGSVGYLDGMFRAADQFGMLASFSLPHVKDFNWKLDTPEQSVRYERLTEWLIRRVQNHPSIVLYAMNHNTTGYYGDQNPLKIDGKYDPDELEGDLWSRRNRAQARIAEGIAKAFDPTRPVYHHQSGNLGDMHTVNIYLNWAPLQERSDWLEHWSKEGIKPLFFVEWGLPHISSWSSYRGPEFIWSSPAFQSIWDSEFAAEYLGDRAYRMSENKVKALELEERLWAQGEPFYWSQFSRGIWGVEENHLEITTLFTNDNWRSHRAWGISAMLPWDQGEFWKRMEASSPMENPHSYEGLQNPGIVPDWFLPGDQYLYGYDRWGWRPTSTGNAFQRWNQPLIAYIGGGPEHFTDKAHNFLPGETVHKQLVILNDTRHERTCEYTWATPTAQGEGEVTIEPGGRAFVPVSFTLPEEHRTDPYEFSARFHFDTGEEIEDRFHLTLLHPRRPFHIPPKVALYDPKGMTTKLLDKLDVPYQRVGSGEPLPGFDLLIVGREALSEDAPCPDLSRIGDGLNVLVFEQTAETLTNRLGFRVNVHGLRQCFPQVDHHPLIMLELWNTLHDWRGSSTLTPPYLEVPELETSDPTWEWCGFRNTRVWRCGNRGNVASVLIEKPPRGNWLPLMEGGFDLQYSPLLEYCEGNSRVVFCQMDVTGRTEADPAAMQLCHNLIAYLARTQPVEQLRGMPGGWFPDPVSVLYAGDERGREVLHALGIAFDEYAGQPLSRSKLLVIGPGAEGPIKLGQSLDHWFSVLCLGLSGEELDRYLPVKINTQEGPTVSGQLDTDFYGVSSADLHWRTKLDIAAIEASDPGDNPALREMSYEDDKSAAKEVIVLCQAAPWMFDTVAKPYLRTSYRRNLFLVSRLLANLGAVSKTDLVGRLASPYRPRPTPWLESYYIQEPQAEDDPYRYYRW